MDSESPLQVSIPELKNLNLSLDLYKKLEAKGVSNSENYSYNKVLVRIGLIQDSLTPKILKPRLLLFAADHGFRKSGIFKSTPSTGEHDFLNIIESGSYIDSLCDSVRIKYLLVDIGVDHSFEGNLSYWLNHNNKAIGRKIEMGSRNFFEQPAMTTAATLKAIETGKALADEIRLKGSNTIGLSDISKTSYWSCLVLSSELLQCPLEEIIDHRYLESLRVEEDVFELFYKAIRKNPKSHDELTLLSMYGGFDIAAITGSILRAAENRMVVLVDGLVACTALLLAYKMNPDCLSYVVVCQVNNNTQRKIMERLGLKPLLSSQTPKASGVPLVLPLIKNGLELFRD